MVVALMFTCVTAKWQLAARFFFISAKYGLIFGSSAKIVQSILPIVKPDRPTFSFTFVNKFTEFAFLNCGSAWETVAQYHPDQWHQGLHQ